MRPSIGKGQALWEQLLTAPVRESGAKPELACRFSASTLGRSNGMFSTRKHYRTLGMHDGDIRKRKARVSNVSMFSASKSSIKTDRYIPQLHRGWFPASPASLEKRMNSFGLLDSSSIRFYLDQLSSSTSSDKSASSSSSKINSSPAERLPSV